MNQAATTNNNKLTADQVAQYLQQHSDFFQQFPDLLLTMNFSTHQPGSISLVDRQMQALRQRNSEIEEELHQVVHNAQDNQKLLQQTIDLTLKLIPCECIADLSRNLNKQLIQNYDIPYNNMLLEKSLFAEHADQCVDMVSIREQLGDNFPRQQPVCGRLKESEKLSLFAEPVPVKSVAILPLGDNGELGLLVLGDEDPSHFDPAMGDLFLLLISDILSRLLYRYCERQN